jgi:hypothetical protein
VALLPCLLASIGGLMAIFNIRTAAPIVAQTFEPDNQTKNTKEQFYLSFRATIDINKQAAAPPSYWLSSLTGPRRCTFLDPQTNTWGISGGLQRLDSLSGATNPASTLRLLDYRSRRSCPADPEAAS